MIYQIFISNAYIILGYLMEELKKVGVIPSLQTNVCPPDPQKINDLQVSYMYHK